MVNTEQDVKYPTGQKYSLELMFAKFATAKIAKDLNPLKVSPISVLLSLGFDLWSC